MLCHICKRPERWAEYQINGIIRACPECKERFANEILMVCQICNTMSFVVKTPSIIEKLQKFIPATITHFWASDVIVPTYGCPECVTFKNSIYGEIKSHIKDNP
jgi:hypothetical protein